MKKLMYAGALTLAMTALIYPDYAGARDDSGRVTHIDSSVQFPPTKARIFRHTLRLHVPQNSSPLSQLSIQVPAGLTASNNISIYDHSGREINANVSVNGSQIILMFTQPITPGTKINIELNDIRRTGVSNAWLYPVSVRLAGSNADIPIGIANLRVY